MKNPSQQTESLETFIEKVSDLADVNELPSKGYRALLTEFSVDDVQMQLNKVSEFLLPSFYLLNFFPLVLFLMEFKGYMLHINLVLVFLLFVYYYLQYTSCLWILT